MADMVIPDLARWEDWSVMDRLVQMFKECDSDETRWVRTPIISYLQACPKPEAKTFIAELREIDPDAAKRAEMLAELDWGDDDDDWGDEEDEESEETPAPPQPLPESEVPPSDKKGESKSDKKDQAQSQRPATEASQPIVLLKPESVAQQYVTTEAKPSSISLPAGNEADINALVPESESARLARRTTRKSPPVAVLFPASPSTMVMILSAFGICVVLFLLLWSVLNGTFHRLIS